MRCLVLLVIVAGSVLVGCGDLFGPDDEVMAAIVLAEYGWPENVPDVRTPDTVSVDQWFRVEIQTYQGCLLEDGRTDVELRDLRAEITPYMRYIGPGNCPDVLVAPIRTVNLRFTASGLASVRVVGLDAIRFPSQQEQNPANEVHVVRQIVVTEAALTGDRSERARCAQANWYRQGEKRLSLFESYGTGAIKARLCSVWGTN